MIWWQELRDESKRNLYAYPKQISCISRRNNIFNTIYRIWGLSWGARALYKSNSVIMYAHLCFYKRSVSAEGSCPKLQIFFLSFFFFLEKNKQIKLIIGWECVFFSETIGDGNQSKDSQGERCWDKGWSCDCCSCVCSCDSSLMVVSWSLF